MRNIPAPATPRHHRRSRTGLHSVSAVTAAALISTHVVSAFQFGSTSTSRTTTTAAHPIPGSRTRSSSSTSTAKHPSEPTTTRPTRTSLCGWLDNFLPKPYDAEAERQADAERRRQYPEQYPATYELLPPSSYLPRDRDDPTGTGTLLAVRPLLKQTQLEGRPLRIAYDANVHGWDGPSFHARVDGCGAAVVLAATTTGTKTEDSNAHTKQHVTMVGGYNPKGWAGLGGARPSVAAFLFYQKQPPTRDGGDDDGREDEYGWQKLAKVGGGGLACANDDPSGGIYFGPDGLVIPLRSGDSDTASSSRARVAQSKLGPYFERGPDDLASIFPGGAACVLEDLKVVVGVYEEGEDIPYSGGVMDMTSG